MSKTIEPSRQLAGPATTTIGIAQTIVQNIVEPLDFLDAMTDTDQASSKPPTSILQRTTMSNFLLFFVFILVGHHFHKRGDKLIGWGIWGIGLWLIWPRWPHDALNLIHHFFHIPGVGGVTSALFLLVVAIIGVAHIFSEKRTVARVHRRRWF